MAGRCGDGARLPRASARGARTAAPDVDHWRVGRPRPALRAVRAHPTALPGVLFAQADVSLSLVMLAGLGTVLLTLDWRLGLVMTLPVPVFCWLIYRHSEEITRLFIRAWRKWSRVTDVLSDTIPGIRVVKAFNQEDREIVRFGERNADVTAEFNRIHASWTTFWPLLVLGVHAMTITVWIFAVPRLLGSGTHLPVGTFVSFLLYTTMFLAPIDVIGQMARTINRATTSAHRVFEVLDTE